MGQAIIACSKAWTAHADLASSLCTQLLADLEGKAQGADPTPAEIKQAMSLTNCWAAIFRSAQAVLGAQSAGGPCQALGSSHIRMPIVQGQRRQEPKQDLDPARDIALVLWQQDLGCAGRHYH